MIASGTGAYKGTTTPTQFSTMSATTTTPPAPAPAPSSTAATQGGLAPWISPFITQYMGQAQALAQTPYQAYQGPLTAGASPLQEQAFQGIGGLTMPNGTYNPVGSDFTSEQAQKYMNPYLQNALNPQLEEIRRQAQITQMGNAAKMTQAGAFGGSRQAVLDAMNQRDMASQLALTTGKGYMDAYDKAAQQFNTDQSRKVDESKFGANYGLDALKGGQSVLDMQLRAGDQQRDIESEGIAADLAEFDKQRQFPYEQIKFQQSMLSGLPASAVSSPATTNPGGIAQLLSVLAGANALTGSGSSSISQLLSNLGLGGLLGGNS